MATKNAPKKGINDIKVKKLFPGSITNKTPKKPNKTAMNLDMLNFSFKKKNC